ncbi:hypothetical protein [Blattabacterium cuenoti]|uniref:hypothetical protein n=1 Tax=Blattabacterium cuenoti TaxID=1653831 RepID=UPI001EEC4E62|nr:hypothetical protein [Blattabacterium cuenoti]
MYEFFLKFHHYIAFLVLIFLIFEMIHILWLINYNIQIKFFFKVILDITVVTIFIQIFFGFLLMIFNCFYLYENRIDFIQILKQREIRSKIIEHPIIMILGSSMFIFFYKKLDKEKKITNTVFFYFLLSVLTIITRFPLKIL